MTTEQGIIQLGIKGKELVISTMAQIKKAKEKAFEMGPRQLASTGLMKLLKGGAKALGGAVTSVGGSDKEDSNMKKLTNAIQAGTTASTNVAQSMAGLNPTELIRSVAGAGFGLAAGLAQGAGNALWGGVGDAAKAIIDNIGKLTDIAITGASNAVSAVKTALPIAIEQEARKSMIAAGGTGMQNVNAMSETMSRAQSAALSNSLIPTIGKINAGSPMEKELIRLFKTENGKVVNREQAMGLSQGNFSSLGTNKGFFLNQISQQANGLPPEMAQAMRAQLIRSVGKPELQTESARHRVNQVEMERQDLANAEAIASATSADIVESNRLLNNLSLEMVKSAGSLNKALNEAAGGLGKFLRSINEEIAKGQEAAKKAK